MLVPKINYLVTVHYFSCDIFLVECLSATVECRCVRIIYSFPLIKENNLLILFSVFE